MMDSLPSVAPSSFVCRDVMGTRCQEISLNTTERIEALSYPEIDIMNVIRRGEISKDFNKGLRNPQSKLMDYHTYNGGCLGIWGAVSSTGFGSNSKPKVSEVAKMYDYLNKPLLDGVAMSALPYNPPSWLEGIKKGGPNSVSGWDKGSTGEYRWEATERAMMRPGYVDASPCPS
jgi:hypothetical protein